MGHFWVEINSLRTEQAHGPALTAWLNDGFGASSWMAALDRLLPVVRTSNGWRACRPAQKTRCLGKRIERAGCCREGLTARLQKSRHWTR